MMAERMTRKTELRSVQRRYEVGFVRFPPQRVGGEATGAR